LRKADRTEGESNLIIEHTATSAIMLTADVEIASVLNTLTILTLRNVLKKKIDQLSRLRLEYSGPGPLRTGGRKLTIPLSISAHIVKISGMWPQLLGNFDVQPVWNSAGRASKTRRLTVSSVACTAIGLGARAS
jgi:hypothetical protein